MGFVGQPPPGYPSPGWPGAYLYPGPGAPAPKRSRAGLIVTVVASVVIVACLGFGTATFFTVRHLDSGQTTNAARPSGYPTDFPTDEPTDQPTDQPTEDPTDDGSTIVHAGDLKRFVMTRPAGAHAWPRIKADEKLTLATAAGDFHDPAEGKVILQRYGFKDGYTRRWIDAHGSFIILRVYRFDDPGSGEDFADFNITADEDGDWGSAKDVPDEPDAAGFVKPKKDKSGYQESMTVGAFSDIAVVVIADQLPPAKVTVPEGVFRQEYDKL